MKFEELYKLIMENSAPRQYSCLMLDLSFLSNEIKKIQEKICPCDVYDLEPGHGLEDEPHCTILYGIHEQMPSSVIPLLDLKPVKFKIKKISLFENAKYDVLKFDIKSEDLNALNKQCTDKLDYTSNFPDYRAHLTIGYLMKGSGKKYCSMKTLLDGQELVSNKFIFSNASSEKIWATV